MKNFILLLTLSLVTSSSLFGQIEVDRIVGTFQYKWNDYLLPESSFYIYHGNDEAYFINSGGRRIPNHSYLDIKTGGKDHFIVQDEAGFHLLNSKLQLVTKKTYDNIRLNFRLEIELRSDGETSYYSLEESTNLYRFSDTNLADPIWVLPFIEARTIELGTITDSRFNPKPLEKLEMGVDNTQTLSILQKRKKVLVKKGNKVVFKGREKPMLYNDFMITGEKGTFAIYHPTSKDPILENCDQFWFSGSLLIVSVKGSLLKHIISKSGEIVLESSGLLRQYEYDLGSSHYSFLCDGNSVINSVNGALVFKSNGELIRVAEHYIYTDKSGAYLGDLSHTIKLECANFERYGVLTIGQLLNGKWRLFGPKSILINEFENFFFEEKDSLLICVEKTRTLVISTIDGTISGRGSYPVFLRAREVESEFNWKYYIIEKAEDDTPLEGRFHPLDGILVKAKYLKIEWPETEDYHIVVTKEGLIRYLDRDGRELFD